MPWIVLPTFDEADNLEGIVAAVRAAPGRVSSSSTTPPPTGPARSPTGWRRPIPPCTCCTAPPSWASAGAYVAGFGTRSSGGRHVFEMDADFSHEPADLPRLLAAPRAPAPTSLLGSRYVPGGGVENWPCGAG